MQERKPNIYTDNIIGPIHSRRLGISLGVNLLPRDAKICSFDCIYCECGWNRDHRGGKFPDAEAVMEELEAKLREEVAEGRHIDVITFAGNRRCIRALPTSSTAPSPCATATCPRLG